MNKSKLGIDFNKVARGKQLAKNISDEVENFAKDYSTVTCERTICRLLGIDGVDANDVPLPNVVVDFVKEKGRLNDGIMYIMGNAVCQTKLSPNEIAEQIALGKLDITTLPSSPEKDARASLQPYIDASLKKIIDRRRKR